MPIPNFQGQGYDASVATGRAFVATLPLLDVAEAWGITVVTYQGVEGRRLGYARPGQQIVLGVAYIGSADDLERRMHEHQQGNGSKLLAAVSRAGIPWQLARTWPGDRTWERRLKRYKKSRRLCPICSAGVHGRMQKL